MDISTLSKEEKIAYMVDARKKQRKPRKTAYFFVAPWYLGYIIFAVIPIGMSIYMSFMDWPVIGSPTFVGWDNFVNIAGDRRFHNSLWVTARYAMIGVPLGLVTSFSVALIMASKTKALNL